MRTLILCALAVAPALPFAACVSNSNPSTPDDAGPPASTDASPSADASPDGPTAADASPDSPAPTGANGLYFGTVADDGGAASHVAVLLTDAGYWLWQYGTNDVTAGSLGSDTRANGTLTTTQAYASTPPVQATTAGQSITGTLGDDAGAAPFQATYSAAYESPASLSAVVGAWSSQVYSGSYGDEAEVITITSTGALTMNNPLGCIATGTITPDPTYGFYELTATFSGGDCIAGSQALTGVAVVDTSNAGAPQLLTSIVTSAHDIDFPSWGTFSPDGG